MPYTIQHTPSPLLTGAAANLAGQEELRRREQEYALQLQQQALRNQAFELQQQQFAEQVRQNQIGNQFRDRQLDQQQFQFGASLNQRGVEAERARQAALAEQALRQRGQLAYLGLQGGLQQQRDVFGAQQDELARQAAAEQAMMQQQAITGRQQMTLNQQADMQLQSHLHGQMMDDWSRVQKAMQDPTLSDDQKEQLVANYQNTYASARTPMPVSIPEPPEDPYDADAVLGRLTQQYPDMPFYRDENGMPAVVRGWNYQMSDQYRQFEQQENQRQQQHDLELEQVKQQQADAKLAMENRRKYADAIAKAQAEAAKLFIREIPPAGGVGQPTVQRDDKGMDEYMMRVNIMSRAAYLDPPSVYPQLPDEFRGLPWVVTEQELNSLPKGTRAAVLVNGQWRLAESNGNTVS